MAKRLRNKQGAIVALELAAEEMAHVLGVEVDDLASWTKTIPPYAKAKGEVIYRVRNVEELNHLKKRVTLLRTRMNEDAVASVEKAGLLDAYSALASDCPSGITAHVWRSYALIVLMQIRYGKMLDAKELAERAGLTKADGSPDVSMAEKHIRLLQGVHKLRIGKDKWEGQWEHEGLPEAWRGT